MVCGSISLSKTQVIISKPTRTREIPQNVTTFVLFGPPKIGHLMTPVKCTPSFGGGNIEHPAFVMMAFAGGLR